ncbi:GntR family transcriptional regulator [Pandoraea bronchicola]|uniref:HTH-type transcriptional regulator McbR n=1 Tax=Pandoraea bronchicola TaxID=2508287 RepID=A0A5E5BXP7_9BURK|nr:GntR family transcriptional regulator [Pandoraea bronchicola]VVE90106.1 HTH-type transcriptional regulator McbR [Pandoraea bronchicola]
MRQESGMGTAVERTYEALREQIGRGELKPGEALRQDHLAAALGVSHVPVREALTMLASDGLAVSRVNRGTVVTALTEADALELADFRAMLEGRLMALAMPNLSRADLSRARAALDALEAATDLADIVTRNAAFHGMLYAKAERPYFQRAVATARLNLGRYLFLTWQKAGNALRSHEEHRELLRLCETGDDAGAVALVQAHNRATGEQIARIIREGWAA